MKATTLAYLLNAPEGVPQKQREKLQNYILLVGVI